MVRDHLDLLGRIFHPFDTKPYFSGSPVEQLECLNKAAVKGVSKRGQSEKLRIASYLRLEHQISIVAVKSHIKGSRLHGCDWDSV